MINNFPVMVAVSVICLVAVICGALLASRHFAIERRARMGFIVLVVGGVIGLLFSGGAVVLHEEATTICARSNLTLLAVANDQHSSVTVVCASTSGSQRQTFDLAGNHVNR